MPKRKKKADRRKNRTKDWNKTKNISGRRYKLAYIRKNKKQAQSEAKALRNNLKQSARIKHSKNKTYPYAVYARNK